MFRWLAFRPLVQLARGGAFIYGFAMDGEQNDWTRQNWDDLVPRLLLLAAGRLSRMTWRGRRRGISPGAAQAEDFVHDAISKTIGGVRRWQADRCTLFQHLAGVIVSDISHLAESLENRTEYDGSDQQEEGSGWPPDLEDGAADAETALAWRTEQQRLFAYLEARDAPLAAMARLMLVEDCRETEDLSPALGVSGAEVANLRKRLKRAVRAFMSEEGEP